jgi:hypothetical protein
MHTHWFVTDAAPGVDRGVVTTSAHPGGGTS